MSEFKKALDFYTNTNRNLTVDCLRGFAILIMIIFHFCYDIYYFKIIEFDMFAPFWKNYRTIIVSLFLTMVGVSLHLAYHNKINWHKLLKRQAILFACALSITITSFVIFPSSWIYFGILHFILVATFVGLIFVRDPTVALILGSLTIILYLLTDWFNMSYLYSFAKPYLPMYTVDLASFIPWFGVVLIGIFIGKHNLFNLRIKPNKVSLFLAMMGQHSLLIYITHQIILFSVIGATAYLFLGLKF